MFGLTDVLGTLKGLSSSFLLSYVFPGLLFAFGSLALYEYAVLELPIGFPILTGDGVLWPIIDLCFVALATAVMLSVLTGIMRQVLEGRFIPAPFARYLVARYDRELRRMLDDENTALQFHAGLKLEVDDAIAQMQQARRSGVMAAAIGNRPLIIAAQGATSRAPTIDLSDTALRLDASWTNSRANELAIWQSVTQAIVAALTVNCADEDAVPAAARIDAITIDRVHLEWARRLLSAVEDAATFENIYYSKRISAFARGDVRPTRFGNLRAIMEAHTRNTYGVDFSYLWPRVQAQADPATNSSASLTKATTQLELALALSVLVSATAVIWPFVLLSLRAYITFGVLTALVPIAAWAAYKFALESQRVLTSNVWAVIDRDRIKVLEAMHIAYPTTTREERNRWEMLLQNAAGARFPIPLESKKAG